MRKAIFMTGILFSGFLVCGCPPERPKVVIVKTDPFKEPFMNGLKYEAQKEWQKAQTAFQAAISAASDDQQTQAAQDRLADVEQHLRLQALYEKFVDYQKAGASDKMHETLSAAYEIAPHNPYIQKMMAVFIVQHKIRQGDLISELCQRYYGKTESYELVKSVNAYNKITNPEKIETGQVIIFPVIDLPEKPLFIPNPKLPPRLSPQPAQIDATTIKVQQVPRQCMEKGISFFNERQFQEAIVQFETCTSRNTEDTTVFEWLSRAYFQLGLNLYSQEKYQEALNAFNACYKNFAGNSECKAYIKKTEKIILEKLRYDNPISIIPE